MIVCPDHGMKPEPGCCAEERLPKPIDWLNPTQGDTIRWPITDEDWEAILGDKE